MIRGPGPKGPSGTLSEAQLARRITRGKNSRRMLSNKPQDFQVGGLCCSVYLLSLPGHCCDVMIDLLLWAGAHLLEGIEGHEPRKESPANTKGLVKEDKLFRGM